MSDAPAADSVHMVCISVPWTPRIVLRRVDLVPHTGCWSHRPMRPNLVQIRRHGTHGTHGTAHIRVQIRVQVAILSSERMRIDVSRWACPSWQGRGAPPWPSNAERQLSTVESGSGRGGISSRSAAQSLSTATHIHLGVEHVRLASRPASCEIPPADLPSRIGSSPESVGSEHRTVPRTNWRPRNRASALHPRCGRRRQTQDLRVAPSRQG